MGSLVKLGKPIAQVRAEGEAKRRSILNSQPYNEGVYFTASEAARILKLDAGGKANSLLESMVDAGLLTRHEGKTIKYSKPGVQWLRMK